MVDLANLRAVASHLRQDPHGNPIEADVNRHRAATVEAAADEIEDLQKKLDACRAGFDRLARQVDGYSRAGKKAEGWRKKT